MNQATCVNIIRADYNNAQHGLDIMQLLNAYALDPMGGGEQLSEHVKHNLINALQEQNNVFTILCYVDDKPAGLINSVVGFSTFNAKPLVNIHDVIVLACFRRRGLTKKMFDAVEEIAKEKQC